MSVLIVGKKINVEFVRINAWNQRSLLAFRRTADFGLSFTSVHSSIFSIYISLYKFYCKHRTRTPTPKVHNVSPLRCCVCVCDDGCAAIMVCVVVVTGRGWSVSPDIETHYLGLYSTADNPGFPLISQLYCQLHRYLHCALIPAQAVRGGRATQQGVVVLFFSKRAAMHPFN